MYPMADLETIALLHGIRHNSSLLQARPFIVHSDNIATVYLNSLKHKTGRAFRYSLLLANYKFEIKHIKGSQNPADLISRSTLYPPQTEDLSQDIYDIV